MSKEEFINFCLENGYQYSESKNEINIDKVIDELGNVDMAIYYNKENKEFGISQDKNVNEKEAPNRFYMLNEIELKILGYLVELTNRKD